jgi:hemoglobin/transferrin/lactoferrin receptor protein
MKLLLSILLFFSINLCISQSTILVNSSTGEPISGVAIFNENKSKSVVSNKMGEVDLTLFLSEELLIVKHISFQERRLYKSDIKNKMILLDSNLQNLDEIILSASKFEENKNDIPKTITRINAKTIGLTNPQTSADLLEKSGKVYIQKSQLGGGSPIIRGFSTNRLLITVDGVRMNNAIFRGGNLQNVISIDPFTIQDTEVTLGAGTVIYGSDAIGGVMSFNTLQPKLSYQDSLILNSNATVRYATASKEQTINANLNLGLKKWAFLSNFSFSSFDDLRMGSNGPDEYLRPEFAVVSRNEDFIVQNQNPLIQKETGYDQVNYMQKVVFAPSSNLDLKLGLFYTKTTDVPRYDRLIRYRGDNLRSAEWYYGPQKWLMANFGLDYRNSNNSFFDNAKVTAAYQKFNESRNDRDFDDIILSSREEQVDALSFNLDLEKIFNSNLSLFYGIEYVHNTISSEGFQTNIDTLERESIVTRYPDGSTWQSAAAYFNLKYKPTQTFTLQSGLRYNIISLKSNFEENNEFLNLPFNEANNTFDAVTGSLGFSWLPNELLNWKFNISTAFRAPNIDDIGKVFDSEPGSVVIPNSDLNPEYAYGGELGLTLNFNKSILLDVNTFYTFLDDALVRRNTTINGESEIIYDGELSDVQSIQNASQAKVYGLELGAKFQLTKHLFSKTQYNVIGGEEIYDSETVPARHVSPNFGNSHLVWENSKITLDAFVNFNGELSNNQLAPSEQEKDYIYALDGNGNPFSPSWYTLNIATQYQLNPNTTLSASLENITDQRYKTYSSGIASPGRNLIVALKYTL